MISVKSALFSKWFGDGSGTKTHLSYFHFLFGCCHHLRPMLMWWLWSRHGVIPPLWSSNVFPCACMGFLQVLLFPPPLKHRYSAAMERNRMSIYIVCHSTLPLREDKQLSVPSLYLLNRMEMWNKGTTLRPWAHGRRGLSEFSPLWRTIQFQYDFVTFITHLRLRIMAIPGVLKLRSGVRNCWR